MTAGVRWAALAIGLIGVIVLGAGQLLLPTLAERSLRADLEEVSEVRTVKIRAFPAAKLLAGHADSVQVELESYRSRPGRLGELLARAGRVGELDVRVRELGVGLLTLHGASVEGAGRTLNAEATLGLDDLERALPPGVEVAPVGDARGDELVFEGRLRAFGLAGSARARVRVVSGRIVVSPDLPFGAFVGVAVFDEERLHVDELSMERSAGQLTVGARGRIVG